jgi:hypothetical protein
MRNELIQVGEAQYVYGGRRDDVKVAGLEIVHRPARCRCDFGPTIDVSVPYPKSWRFLWSQRFGTYDQIFLDCRVLELKTSFKTAVFNVFP